MRHSAVGKLLMTAVLACAGLATAASNAAPGTYSDAEITRKAIHEIRMYPYYSIWDNINLRVREGNVEVTGEVNQPVKKADLQRLMTNVPGVASVTNHLKVLPLSPFDDRLRLQVARAIYRDPVLSRYAMGPVGPIHIIVENGHVTLEGVVSTDMEKN